MSIEIKLSFTSIDEAIAFLSAKGGVTAPAKEAAAPKPAKAEKPAASSPIAEAAPATAASATPAPSSQAATDDVLPYAPMASRISELVAVANPNSAANRTAIKAFFATLTVRYGTPVKTGADVKAEDRPALATVLAELS